MANPMPGARGVYAIRNARIVTVTGPVIERGTVVIGADGKITAVGADVAVPANATSIDATGHIVYPGMMDAGTSMGLSEIPQGAASTVDVSETGSFNPNAQAYYGMNPHSAHVGVTRWPGRGSGRRSRLGRVMGVRTPRRCTGIAPLL